MGAEGGVNKIGLGMSSSAKAIYSNGNRIPPIIKVTPGYEEAKEQAASLSGGWGAGKANRSTIAKQWDYSLALQLRREVATRVMTRLERFAHGVARMYTTGLARSKDVIETFKYIMEN